MPRRFTPFTNSSCLHIFNRGVEKRLIFSEERDYLRFYQTLYYYQFSDPKPRFSTKELFKDNTFESHEKIVEVACYCFMPNHFHLLVKQLKDGGIHEFIRKALNSYAKYFNTKHRRVGPLFQGQFKAVEVESDEQLMQVSRYIHLNPFVGDLTNNWETYPYSSYMEYCGLERRGLCCPTLVLSQFKDVQTYYEFIKDYESYALEIARIKDLLLDTEE